MSGERIDVFVDQSPWEATIDCNGFEGDKCKKELELIGALMGALGADLDVQSSEKKRPDVQREVTHGRAKVKA